MSVQGYGSRTSVAHGERIAFHMGAAAQQVYAFAIERVAGGQVATFDAELPASGPSSAQPWEHGYGWPVVHGFDVPDEWPSGLYKVTHDGTTVLTFVVRPREPGATSKILFQICVATPNAYNKAGGKSLYDAIAPQNRATRLTFDRPENVERFEYGFIAWLVEQGLTVEYCTSIDLHDGAASLHRYDLLLSVGHDEYWSKEMRDRVEQFIRGGGNVGFFTANTAMRQVRFEHDNRVMVCVKEPVLDAHSDCDCVSISFAQPPVNRPQNTMLGVGFDHGGYIGAGATDAFTVRFPDHWVFEGVNGAGLPSGLADFEVDAADYVEEEEGYPRVTGDDGSPRTFTILATADVRHWPGKPGRGTMGLFSRNGTVFNAATVVWASHLGDATVSRITRNVITRLSTRSQFPHWEQIGGAHGVVGLAAVEGRLFAVTDDNVLRRRFPVGADVPWRAIGHAGGVRGLTASGNLLFGVTGGNELLCRDIIERETDWRSCGGGAPGGTRALAAAGGLLYAIDGEGRLVGRAATADGADWREVGTSDWKLRIPRESTITAMTSCRDMLVATTRDGRLLRTNWDFIWEATGWATIGRAVEMTGIAVIDATLFAVTTDGRLLSLDLFGLRR